MDGCDLGWYAFCGATVVILFLSYIVHLSFMYGVTFPFFDDNKELRSPRAGLSPLLVYCVFHLLVFMNCT